MNPERTAHAYPQDDLIGHELVADECPCGPEVILIQAPTGDGWLVKHHSLDGREKSES